MKIGDMHTIAKMWEKDTVGKELGKVERINVSLPLECYADLRVLSARNKSSISGEIYKMWETQIRGTLNNIAYSGSIDWEQVKEWTPTQIEKFLDQEMTTLYNDIYDKWKEQQLLLNGKTMEKLYGRQKLSAPKPNKEGK